MENNIQTIDVTISLLKKGDRFLFANTYQVENEYEFISVTESYGPKYECKYIPSNRRCYFADPSTVVKLIRGSFTIKSTDRQKIDNIVNNSPDKKLKLYLGCFNKPIPHWVNVDLRPYPETLCDVVDDILKLEKFEDASADLILSIHTLEHVGRYEYKDALTVWFKKLKKNGRLFLSVPDINAACEHYIYHRDLEFLLSFFVGSQKHKYDYHYMVFNWEILSKALEEVGFTDVKLFDWQKTDWSYCDSYAGAYAKHLDRSSRLMSLNIEATKI